MNYQSDIEAIIARRYDNGADLWTTNDKRICKGSPFSTVESLLMLSELGETSSFIVRDATDLILSLWREDGQFQIAPSELATMRYNEILNNLKPS